MNLFNDLLNISNPEQFLEMDFNQFENVTLYCKDSQGKHFAGNNQMAINAGHSKAADLFGLTVYDLALPFTAHQITKNDEKVLTEKKMMHFFEFGNLNGCGQFLCLSHKMPLFYSDKNVGIFGISFYLDMEADSSFNSLIQSATSQNPSYASLLNKKIEKNSDYSLTIRQADCLYYLVLGFTIKEIAKEMKLSPKTIEHYLETVKNKFNCKNRAELIQRAIRIKYIKDKIDAFILIS